MGPSMLGVVPVDDEDDTNIIMDSLRAVGLVRRRVEVTGVCVRQVLLRPGQLLGLVG